MSSKQQGTAPPLTIWCNAAFPDRAIAQLREGTSGHRLVFPAGLQNSNLTASGPDPVLEQADIALGQPDPGQIMSLDRIRWVHLTSAGYTRYDTAELRAAFKKSGQTLTNSSLVYDDPCAQHVLAMMLGLARQLPPSLIEQQGDRGWRAATHRIHSYLLTGQTAVIFGYGAIARRLAHLLKPFDMQLIGVRRNPRGDEPIRAVSPDDGDTLLVEADHVINILPANAESDGFFDTMRFARFKKGATFYNIGRGSTVNQSALIHALEGGRLRAAYLDVTDPEPLPPGHALWTAPNCYITPHTAGGHEDEFERLVGHFLENLKRYERGEGLRDKII